MSSRAPTTQPINAPTRARTSTSRQPGTEPRQRPARPAATPTQPTAKIWYGTQGPIPPPANAETRIVSAPARNPNEVPKTYPAHSTRKKIGLNPPMPSITASRRAVSMAAIAARRAKARESSWRVPVSTRKSPATAASASAQAGVLEGSALALARRQVARIAAGHRRQSQLFEDRLWALVLAGAIERHGHLGPDGGAMQHGRR